MTVNKDTGETLLHRAARMGYVVSVVIQSKCCMSSMFKTEDNLSRKSLAYTRTVCFVRLGLCILHLFIFRRKTGVQDVRI